jgi:16S rRNA (guanine527-N7)-methyltransferase
MNFVPRESRFLDIGSGGGFPAIVLAISGIENYTLVESDIRKCQFLEEAKRIFNLKCTIICERVEKLHAPVFDVITSRAFADLKVILSSTKNLVTPDTIFYLHKTEGVIKGLDSLQKKWLFHVERLPSVTSDSQFIIKISGVRNDKSETS